MHQWQVQVARNKKQAVPHPFRHFHISWDLVLRKESRVVSSDQAFRAFRQLHPVFEEKGVGGARLLFSSSSAHDCSDRALLERIGTRAPTIVLVRTTEGSVCGGYAGGSWGNRGQEWTNSGGKSFLFSLEGPGNGAAVGVVVRCCEPRMEMRLAGGLHFGAEDLVVSFAQSSRYSGGGGSRRSSSHRKFAQCVSRLGQCYRSDEQQQRPQQRVDKNARSLVKEGPSFQCEELEVWHVGPLPLPE